MEISKKEAALISTAIAAYLAKPVAPRAAGISEEAAITRLRRDLRLLLKRVADLEGKMDKLNMSMSDLRRRVDRIEKR